MSGISVSHITAHILRSRGLSGYRIALLGDFHLAPWRSVRPLREAVARVNDWQPDAVALVGDYGHSLRWLPSLSARWYRSVLPHLTRELATLRSRDGVFAVLGNHDHDVGAGMVEAALIDAGVTLATGRCVDVARAGTTLRVIGLSEATGRAGAGESPTNAGDCDAAALLVLAHRPDCIARCAAISRTAPTIVLAGHTHGGQIVLPGFGAPVTLSRTATRRFPGGLVPNDYATLYVTRGLGEQIPIRWNAARELPLLELALR